MHLAMPIRVGWQLGREPGQGVKNNTVTVDVERVHDVATPAHPRPPLACVVGC
jgi:hypothetical protein